jgi:phosphate transport system substrate-binding protein
MLRSFCYQVFDYIVVFVLLTVLAASGASAETLRLGGSGSTTRLAKLLADAYIKKYPQDQIVISPVLGTPGGIEALRARAVDVALASRVLSDKEQQSGGLSATEFARTPLVMAVAAANPIKEISFAQLSKIYGTTDAVWPDGSRVRLVLRPREDTDSKIVSSFSPEVANALNAAIDRPGSYVAPNDEEAIAALQRLPGALGPTTLAQILADKLPLKALVLEGRQPTVASLRDGKYPYYKRHLFVVGADVTPVAQRFIAFAQSAEGSRLLSENGCWTSDFKGK